VRLVPLLVLALGLAASPVHATPRPDLVRGIVLSTHTDGSDWGSPELRSTLEEIRGLGAEWITIHPYCWIEGNGTVHFERLDPASLPYQLAHPIREAHALGLKILIQPHVGYWGSPFSWAGAITFQDNLEWDRFFRSYRDWVTNLAETCREADGFVVGTELDSTLSREAEWRQIIADVRTRTKVPLTYAANWNRYREVPFWDVLDVIGIQAYFPLADSTNADDAALREGWGRVIREVRAFSEKEGRKVVFTELGYNRSLSAAVRPWEYHVDGPEAEAMQVRCFRVALAAIREEPSIVGVFLWKWFPNPHPVGRNFQLATPAVKSVISEAWKE
jgi:hypothetical protein